MPASDLSMVLLSFSTTADTIHPLKCRYKCGYVQITFKTFYTHMYTGHVLHTRHKLGIKNVCLSVRMSDRFSWSICMCVCLRVSLYPIQKPFRHIRPVFGSDSSHPIIALTAGNGPCFTNMPFRPTKKKPSKNKTIECCTKMHSKFMNDCAKCLSKIYVNGRD